MVQYVFRDERPLGFKNGGDADPQLIGMALQTIKDGVPPGLFKPDTVLASARDGAHVLHRHFEWQDSIAAHAHRLEQARALIRCIDIVPVKNEPPKRAFISVTEPNTGTSYRSLGEVLESPDLQLIVLKQAERDFISYERRLREFEDICSVIRVAREAITAKRFTLESTRQ